jgi:F0F1-type ATP synthase assembly protein I
MLDILPFRFELDKIAIAGSCLWSLALYLAFSPIGEWVTEQLNRWFNFAERSLYTSQTEFEKTRKAREAQNAFYASLFSIVPFIIAGALFNWVIKISLSASWGISTGILACMGAGIYELGRRDGESSD